MLINPYISFPASSSPASPTYTTVSEVTSYNGGNGLTAWADTTYPFDGNNTTRATFWRGSGATNIQCSIGQTFGGSFYVTTVVYRWKTEIQSRSAGTVYLESYNGTTWSTETSFTANDGTDSDSTYALGKSVQGIRFRYNLSGNGFIQASLYKQEYIF